MPTVLRLEVKEKTLSVLASRPVQVTGPERETFFSARRMYRIFRIRNPVSVFFLPQREACQSLLIVFTITLSRFFELFE